jgi:hypothetical protein
MKILNLNFFLIFENRDYLSMIYELNRLKHFGTSRKEVSFLATEVGFFIIYFHVFIYFSRTSIIFITGYGNIAPATTMGRFFCMFFAFIGIPFTLTVIADLGSVMASSVSVVYKKMKVNKNKLTNFFWKKIQMNFFKMKVKCRENTVLT